MAHAQVRRQRTASAPRVRQDESDVALNMYAERNCTRYLVEPMPDPGPVFRRFLQRDWQQFLLKRRHERAR